MPLPSLLSLALYSPEFAGVGVVATSTTFGEPSDETDQAHQQYTADLVLSAQTFSLQVISFLYSQYLNAARRGVSIWEMVQLAAICGAVPCLWLIRSRLSKGPDRRSQRQSQAAQSANESANNQKNNVHLPARMGSAGKPFIS
jgi:hypothetical protein